MKVYISGPITGTTDYMERFEEAQKYLKSKGFDVVNPALVNSNLPKNTSYREYMLMSLLMLSMCDHIYMLRGYEKSAGARKELVTARDLNIRVLYEQTPADMHPDMLSPAEIDYIKDDINRLFGVGL